MTTIKIQHDDGETKTFDSHIDAALFLAGHDGRGSRFGRDQHGEMVLFFTTHHGKEQVAFRGKGGHVENDAEAVEMLAQEACTHEWGHWGASTTCPVCAGSYSVVWGCDCNF
jgi:hypothetical protein